MGQSESSTPSSIECNCYHCEKSDEHIWSIKGYIENHPEIKEVNEEYERDQNIKNKNME